MKGFTPKEKSLIEGIIMVYPYILSGSWVVSREEFDRIFTLIDIINKQYAMYLNTKHVIYDLIGLVLMYDPNKELTAKDEYRENILQSWEMVVNAIGIGNRVK